MKGRGSWRTFLYFLRMHPQKSVLMAAALSVGGLLEGMGIAALLPMIVTLTGQAQGGDGVLAQAVGAVFARLGLEPSILHTLVFIVVAMAGKAFVSFFAVRQVAYTSSHVAASLRLEYVRNLLEADWLHYVGLRSGATANALGYEAERSALSFRQGCQALASLIQIAVYGLLAFMISWQLTAAAFATGVLLSALLGFLIRRSRSAGRELAEIYNRILSLITDTLFGAKPLKAMNKGGYLFRMIESDISALQKTQRRIEIYDQSMGIMAEPIMIVVVCLGLFGALTFTAVPVPDLLFMAIVFLRMVMRITAAQRSYQLMAANEGALWSLREKISAADESREHAGGGAPSALTRDIVFDRVDFSYGDRPIFRGLSLSVPARRFTLFLGPSGAGKTTLIDMIAGLHRPDGGRILVDGADMGDLDRAAWRSRIGYVPQDVLLFHDTIYHNITLNDDSLTMEDVEDALAKAGALDFVRELEAGIDTVAGERGARLSGGQRQRIAIARALVHKPQLLILDEATSALDTATEEQILQTVKALSCDITILAISHNAALAEAADIVYDIAGGTASTRPHRTAV